MDFYIVLAIPESHHIKNALIAAHGTSAKVSLTESEGISYRFTQNVWFSGTVGVSAGDEQNMEQGKSHCKEGRTSIVYVLQIA
jgi:hypothetical protein